MEARIAQQRMEVFSNGLTARERLQLMDEEAERMFLEIRDIEMNDEGEGATVGDFADMAEDGVATDMGN